MSLFCVFAMIFSMFSTGIVVHAEENGSIELVTEASTVIVSPDSSNEAFNVDVVIPQKPFPRIKLAELYQVLESEYNFKMNYEDIGDMNAESEKLASKYIKEKYGHEFVFVTDFSAKKRAFYHKRENGIPQGADLIWKSCETTTLALREHRYEILCNQAKEKGLGEDVKFYLEFFKYGMPPHGGFGVGMNRILMRLFEIDNIREATFIYRGPTRLNP